MSCELCGGGDKWIKTCLTPEGSRLLVCDPCYEEHASVLVIVPGDRTVTARCDHCWRYGNPREFVEVAPGRTQERLLGDVWGVRRGGCVTGPEREIRLPPGYRLDRSDPDLWALRRPEGWVVAYFSARGATKEAIEQVAWEDHEGAGEEQYP